MNDNININDSDIKPELTFRNLCFMYMKQLINFPYIEKDFDAITDYQFLCLVVKYLNKVIDNSNKQNESITNLYNAFLQLQTYMNNSVEELEDAFNTLNDYVRDYFDNLDVQDEINNKLDQMLEDGVLTEIIQQFLQSTAIWCFDTVADMKQATNLINGSFAKTLGYYSVNDGGEAIYKITDTESLTDYQEELTSGLYATLITNNELNLMNVGCYGNGVNDDTNKVKDAITYAVANNLTIVSSNNKTYLLSDDITIANINIDLGNSIFKTDNSLIITANQKIIKLPKIISISSLSSNIGVNLIECYTCEVNIPLISGFTIGLQLTGNNGGCVYNKINIQEIFNCLTSIKLKNESTGWVNENMFVGGRLWSSSDFTSSHASDIIKIHLDGNSSHYMNNNYFLKQCIEGDEGTSNGLKLKLNNARYNIFESLRYEGTDAKIEVTNSRWNLISNGYGVPTLTFTNEKMNISLNGDNISTLCRGLVNDTMIDFTPSSNTIDFFKCKRADGTLSSKINATDGLIEYTTTGDEMYRFSFRGLQAYYNNDWKYLLRHYSKWTTLTNCDFTNGGLVISPGIDTANACYLWIYDGHLRGKIGAPSSESDGSIIL